MYTVEQIISELQGPKESDIALIKKAYAYAAEAHKEHKRYSGEPYMVHLAAVGYKLAAMGMGPRTISAGLLHDSIEDTDVTDEDIRTNFSEEILFLVDGVTKLSSVRYYGRDRHNESLRKLFVATSQDIRVLIIKLNDRLHNMETLGNVPVEKQLRIARETLEIYVPVAHRLGMGKIRKELEDLAFPFVYPEEAEKVEAALAAQSKRAEETLEKERKILQRKLAESNLIDFQTTYRVKGRFSLYHKLKRKDWDIDSVYDFLAMRVVVKDVATCYQALGIIHKLWRPLPGRVKDYIAFPKPNGYQSIHTTVTTQNGVILEIQIRTEQMHREAEFGVASHVFYKPTSATDRPNEKKSRFSQLFPMLFNSSSRRATESEIDEQKDTAHNQKIPRWISQIGQTYTHDEHSTANFVEDMESDFFSRRIFVFTPAGDVVDLPVGATPIDFAYTIHSEIGDHTASVKVNKKMAQLDSELKNGDIVEIETKRNAHPSEKWMLIAKTSIARRRIKQALDADKESN